MKFLTYLLSFAGLFFLASSLVPAVETVPGDFVKRDLWVAAKMEGKEGLRSPGMVVLRNHDPVLRNQHMGKPLKIGGKQFKRGLFCHAPRKISVRLPSTGRTFSALVGIDNNVNGTGSVDFLVSVQNKEVFHSGILHRHKKAVPVEVDLQGATEFIIEASDGGDGNGADQSCWAEAKVTLESGQELWLDELPDFEKGASILDSYSSEPFFSFV